MTATQQIDYATYRNVAHQARAEYMALSCATILRSIRNVRIAFSDLFKIHA